MVIAPLAIDLSVILACLGALILILLARNLSEALIAIVRHTAGKLPVIGGLFGKGADWVEKQIVSQMSDIANGLEGLIGTFWHALGNLLASIGHEIYGLAVAFNNFADYLHNVVRPYVIHAVLAGIQHGARWLRKELAATKTQVFRVTKVIEHPVHSKIGGAVRTITRPLFATVHALERWTRMQIAAIDHAIDVVLPRDIAGLRARAKALEREYSRLWKQVRSLDKLTAAGALTAVVALALTRLGLGWLKCSNWSRVGRSVCRLPVGLLEQLFSDAIEAFIVTDLCDFIGLVSAAAKEFEPLLLDFVKVENVLIGCHGASAPAALPLNASGLPPGMGYAALAA